MSHTERSAKAVPTVDLGSIDHDPAAMQALDAACQEHGFFLLTGHGIDREIAQMWVSSAAFFTGDPRHKDAIRRTESQPLGYYDRELTKQQRDLKEVFDYTEPRRSGARQDPNQWPVEPAGFKAAMTDFYQASGNLAETTLALVYRALAAGLEQPAKQPAGQQNTPALPAGSVRTSNVRLNYYPTSDPLSASDAASTTALGSMALHHHTDPGLITLLLQDATGGLQTQLRNGSWIDVPPNPDAVVVNLGDALQVLSNDRYRAAVHRVQPMQGQARYSTPFFLNPMPDATLAPIASLTDQLPRYRAFSWREYITHRIDDNYADLGAEDTQISHYRIAS
ncbi:MAG: isopenicillin N synthase family dioxygenase [Pseudomonadales bacterium]